MESVIGLAACLAVAQADCGPLSFTGPEILGYVDSADVTEASGLAASWRNPGIFWTHNDGAREKVFALGADAHLAAVFKLSKSVYDIEDIAVGPGPDPQASYIYVGDIGSNSADRDEVQILRTPEPAVSGGTADFKDVEVFHVKYPKGKYDAEALLLDPIARELYIATKESDGSHLFRMRIDALRTDTKTTMEEVAQLAFSRISGGAISKDGSLIALRREDEAHVWQRLPGESVLDALKKPAAALPVVGPPNEPNGEALSFLPDSSGYVTLSEGSQQPMFLFRRTVNANQPEFVGEPTRTAGGIQLLMRGCAGAQVVLQRSDDLQGWSVAEEYTSAGEIHTYLDSDGAGKRFYRLLAL